MNTKFISLTFGVGYDIMQSQQRGNMLEKTIKQTISKKVRNWLETITDDSVKDAIKKDLIITGGCFTSMIHNEMPNDYDCYFRTKETVLKVMDYYVDLWNKTHPLQKNKLEYRAKVMVLDCDNPSNQILNYYDVENIKDSRSVMINNFDKGRVKIIFPSDGIVGNPEEANSNEELGVDSTIDMIQEIDEVAADEIIEKEKKKYFPVFISSNAITLSDKIQLVCRFYGEPDEIHDTYDFVHTRAYYDCGKSKLVIPAKVYETTINKTLLYTGSKYPVASLFRLRKFIKRGWKINAGQILKIAMQVSELDLMDINVLEDQLIGVDSVYFMSLINQFRKMKEKDSEFVLTSGYIVSIIDKIF